jgi:hypothetical protein
VEPGDLLLAVNEKELTTREDLKQALTCIWDEELRRNEGR